MFLQPYGHFEAVHPPAPAPLGPEQVFMESLTQRLQQANPHGGGSQQGKRNLKREKIVLM